MYRFLNQISLTQKFLLVIFGLMIMIPGGLMTESHFKKVGYPGAESGGIPITFNLDKKLSDLHSLKIKGTLRELSTTQYFDIGIILGTLVFFSSLTIMFMHRLKERRGLYLFGKITFTFFLLAPIMDAFENIFLLMLIRDPLKSAINLTNSMFTLGKILCFSIGWTLLGILILANILDILKNRSHSHPPSLA